LFIFENITIEHTSEERAAVDLVELSFTDVQQAGAKVEVLMQLSDEHMDLKLALNLKTEQW
jgi:hypothetical protein